MCDESKEQEGEVEDGGMGTGMEMQEEAL